MEDFPICVRLSWLPLNGGVYLLNLYGMLNVPHKYECRTQLRAETVVFKRFPVGIQRSQSYSRSWDNQTMCMTTKCQTFQNYRHCGLTTV